MAEDNGEFFDLTTAMNGHPYENFRYWFVLHATSGHGRSVDAKLIEQISEASDNLKNLQLDIKISGVDIPKPWFFVDIIERQFEQMVEDRARGMVAEKLNGLFDELDEDIDTLKKLLCRQITERAAELKIDTTEEWWKDLI